MSANESASQLSLSVRRPIWVKITGITVVLLGLMGIVTYSSSANLKQLSRELAVLSHYDIPLDRDVSDIRYYNLAQMLFFERVATTKSSADLSIAQSAGQQVAQELTSCSREAITTANQQLRESLSDQSQLDMAMYYIEGRCADFQIDAAQHTVNQALALPFVQTNPDLLQKFTRVQSELGQLPLARNILLGVMSSYLKEQQKADTQSMAVLKEQLDANRRLVGQQTSEITRQLHEYTQQAAERADDLEAQAFWINWGITAAAAILGFLFASALTRNLVKPVRQLLSGAQAIEQGNLNIKINVRSADEIALLAHSFNYMVSGLKEKESIKETFGKYVDPRIVSTLLENNALAQSGEKRVMTVFFSDIEGFTTLCEQMTPENVVRLLNQYFSTMSEPIAAHYGIIDKYIGDAIMAFWGPPFTGAQEHAMQACLAAIDQVERLDAFRKLLPDITGLRRGLPHFNIRIGICTGDVTVGTIGSASTKNYTVIGDTVNLASRLEAANKHYGTHLIITEDTYRLAENSVEARELDCIRVFGKSEPVRIFELLGRKGQLSEARQKLKAYFEQGLHAYRQRDWVQAKAAFQNALGYCPDDTPCSVFLQRIDYIEEHTPEADWDSTWNFDSK